MELKGKTVLVTGAAKRIGRAIALGFAKKGSRVLVHYHTSSQDAETLIEELKEYQGDCRSYQADLAKLSALKTMASKILDDVGTVDILVNNASLFGPTPFDAITEEQWDQFIDIHLKATFFLSQALAPAMRKKGEGRIINIADWIGLNPRENFLAYSTSKGALLTLSKGLAKELAPEILVNVVCPGPILPPTGMNEAEQEDLRKKTLLGRWGTPEDVVRTVLFLAEQDYATGSHYLMDGGELLKS